MAHGLAYQLKQPHEKASERAMDMIARALQRAKESTPVPDLADTLSQRFVARRDNKPRPVLLRQDRKAGPETTPLDESLLVRNRMVAFDPTAAPTRYYDILRSQITHDQRKPGPQIVAVCGPTRGCGTTVTAVNLAFSFARLSSHRVVLLDANDDNPSVRRSFGLPGQGWLKHVDPTATEFLTAVQVRDVSMRVMTLANARETGREALLRIPRPGHEGDATVVVIDLPPLLTAANAASFLSLAEAVVVVFTTGLTTHAEVESTKSLLGRRDGVQYVLNRSGRHGL